jgi:hypothetical protein
MAFENMKKMVVITKIGLYDWMVMSFGLKNATSVFTKTMSKVFKELGDKFLKVFVDDLNVHNESWDEHLQHLSTMFLKLKNMNWKFNPSKCCFVAKSITFLGHVVNNKGTKLDPGKINAVMRFLEPKAITNIKSFLGLTGYY